MADRQTELNYQSLARDLQNKNLQPVYFFYGAEDYLIDKALKLLKKSALEPGSEEFNWTVFRADSDEMDWSLFADSLNSLALIPSQRVVVLKQVNRALRNKGALRIIESIIKQPPADLTFVLVEREPDLKKAFYKTIIQHSTVVNFPVLRSAELQRQLVEFTREFGKEISAAALEKILTETDPSLRELLQKLEVLIFYIGDQEVISEQDVETCTAFTREVEIFNLLKAIGGKDASACRRIAEQLIQKKVEIGALFTLLYRQIWAMYRMKYLQEQRVPNWKWQEHLNIRPQFLEKRYRQYIPNYSRGELGRSLEILAEADLARKTTAIQDDVLLRTLIEKLLKP